MMTALVPIKGSLDTINIGPDVFHISLDHLLHLLVYFLICLYYLFGQKKALSLFKRNSFLKFILLILLLGTVTELIQFWIPERTFSLFDLISNMGGICLGIVVIILTRMINEQEGRIRSKQ